MLRNVILRNEAWEREGIKHVNCTKLVKIKTSLTVAMHTCPVEHHLYCLRAEANNRRVELVWRPLQCRIMRGKALPHGELRAQSA